MPENLNLKHKPDGAMIGAEYIVVDKCFFDPVLLNDIVGDEEVINPPSNVPCSCLKAVGPPRVFYSIRKKMPEGVHITLL